MLRLYCYIVMLFLITACSGDEQPYHPIPSVPVDIQLNLTNLTYQQLTGQGWQYFSGGVKGIIVLKDNGIYRAFDRACTYQSAESCAQIDIHSSTLYLLDEGCCESTFDRTGAPTSGPASINLREYSVILDGDWLYIYN